MTRKMTDDIYAYIPTEWSTMTKADERDSDQRICDLPVFRVDAKPTRCKKISWKILLRTMVFI